MQGLAFSRYFCCKTLQGQYSVESKIKLLSNHCQLKEQSKIINVLYLRRLCLVSFQFAVKTISGKEALMAEILGTAVCGQACFAHSYCLSAYLNDIFSLSIHSFSIFIVAGPTKVTFCNVLYKFKKNKLSLANAC